MGSAKVAKTIVYKRATDCNRGGFMSWRLMRILMCAALVLSAGASTFAATGTCDRACLEGILNQYLNAVIKHDPSGAPLFIAFRETENAVVIDKGQGGLWKTLTGLGKMQRRYL